VSKFFERAIFRQLSQYFENIFHPFLSAFRPGFGCNTAPLKMFEDWKKAIDFNQYTAAVLVDLSKAFDCLPQDLLTLWHTFINIFPSTKINTNFYTPFPFR
jgi:hypothetical protein